MKFGLTNKVIEHIQQVLEANLKIDKAIIFGSRAKGNYKNGSDIDIAIKGENLKLDEILSLDAKLDVPYKIDLVNYDDIKEPALIEHIDRVGIEIYSKWKKYKLSEITNILTGFPFQGDLYKSKGTLKVVRGENVTIGNLRWDSEKYWNNSIAGLEKYFLHEDDIVIGMDGSRVGQNRAIIKKNELPLILAQRVACIRSKTGFYQKYLWYNIFSKQFQDYIESIYTGTSIPHISQSQIGEFEISAPPEKEQIAIAAILNSLDNKIYLLERQNEILESLAETLFRQRFIEEAKDFWKEQGLLDNIDLVGGGTPKTDNPDYWEGNIKWLSGGDIASNHKGFVKTTEKSISAKGLQNSAAKLLPKFATIISARGTVGKYCLLSEPMAFSQSNYGILPKYSNCFFFTYLLIGHAVEELQAAAYGSVFDTITTSTFKGYHIPLPDIAYIKQFEEQVSTFFEKILSNTLQIVSLIDLRETLLPKLLSGEVRLKMP